MNRWMAAAGVACLVGTCGALFAAEAAAPPASLDEALKQVAVYKYGDSRKALIDTEAAIRASFGNAEGRKAIVAKLLALLGAAETTPDAKRFICQQLSIIAGPEAVPAAAKLLPDPDLSHSGRTILERVPGPEAAAALRAALSSLKEKLLIGVLNTIGERRDKDSAADVAKFLGDADAGVASAAATALGKIGGADATKALAAARAKAPAAVKPAVANAYLRCADHLVAEGKPAEAAAIYLEMTDAKEPKNVRIAGLRGLVVADSEKALPLITAALSGDDPEMQAIATSFLRDMKGAAVIKAFVELLPKLKPNAQALVIAALADTGDAAARPAMLASVKSDDAAVRAAALRGLAKVGTVEDVALLAKTAAAGADTDKAPAAESLTRLAVQGADEAMLKLLDGADVPLRTAVIRTLGARRSAAATPALLKAAEDADETVRIEALKALEAIADEKTAAALVKLLVSAKTPNERATAEKTVFTVVNKAKDVEARVEPLLAALPAAATDAKCALLRVAGRLGGAKALAAIRAALKDQDAAIKDAAIRALASWPDATVAADLLDLAKNAPQPTQKIIALQNYIRVVGLPSDRPADATLKMYTEAMELATRPDEKRLILGGLGQVKHIGALKMAAACLDDKAVANEACVAVVAVAKEVGTADKAASKEALEKVLQTTKDKRLINDARGLIGRMK